MSKPSQGRVIWNITLAGMLSATLAMVFSFEALATGGTAYSAAGTAGTATPQSVSTSLSAPSLLLGEFHDNNNVMMAQSQNSPPSSPTPSAPSSPKDTPPPSVRTIEVPDATFIAPLRDNMSSEDKQLETYRMLSLLGEIVARIEDRYVSDFDRKVLFEGAIKGMLGTLDPYSVYLDATNYENLRDATSGEYSGIGARIGPSPDFEGRVILSEIFRESPSEIAGLKEGDVIVAIDGQSVAELQPDEIVDRLRGPTGSEVILTIRRPPAASSDSASTQATQATQAVTPSKPSKELDPTWEEQSFTIVRGNIRSFLVSTKRYGNIGYLSLTSFSRTTEDELRKAITLLNNTDNKRSFDGYILDLRNNPGGLLEQALKVSDLFLEGGEIVTIRNERKGEDQQIQRFYAEKGDILEGKKLVLLINRGTASASEIVAGALKDQERATIVGVKSFGKGAVQDIFDMGPQVGLPYNQIALKLTTRRYYTPAGVSIDHVGLNPHFSVANPSDELDAKVRLNEDRLNEDDQASTSVENSKTAGEQDVNLSAYTPPVEMSVQLNGIPARAQEDRQLVFALRYLGYTPDETP